jgi:hypothetical protein
MQVVTQHNSKRAQELVLSAIDVFQAANTTEKLVEAH